MCCSRLHDFLVSDYSMSCAGTKSKAVQTICSLIVCFPVFHTRLPALNELLLPTGSPLLIKRLQTGAPLQLT